MKMRISGLKLSLSILFLLVCSISFAQGTSPALSTLELVGSHTVTAGQAGAFTLRITVGPKDIAPGGGFTIYPPISTSPHWASGIRWKIGSVYVENDPGKQWNAWISRVDYGIMSGSIVEVIRMVNKSKKPIPSGTVINLRLLDVRISTLPMKGAWFAMEEDTDGIGPIAFNYGSETVAPKDEYSWVRGNWKKAVLVDILPGKATRLFAQLSSKPDTKGHVWLSIRAEDDFGNCTNIPDSRIFIESEPNTVGFPKYVDIPKGDKAVIRHIDGVSHTRKSFSVLVKAPKANLIGVSTPCFPELSQSLYFGDLHAHTELSDGLGSPDSFFTHARDERFLDFVSLTDHDRFDEVVRSMTDKYHHEGDFVTIYGRERGDNRGHMNVYGLDWHEVAAFEGLTVDDTWKELPKHDVIGIPHHTNAWVVNGWSNHDFSRFEPTNERLIEVVQNRGSFENETVGGPIIEGGRGSSARSALMRGFKLGFVGGTDSHQGCPGGPSFPLKPYINTWNSQVYGLTVIQADSLTRKDLWQALKERRTYCTTGVRILVSFSANGKPMGSILKSANKLDIRVKVCGTAPIRHIDVIGKSGTVAEKSYSAGNEAAFTCTVNHPKGFYYVRIEQSDGHFAYISPVWCE